MSTIRKNINMSIEVAKWYEDKAKELGISQSALMVLALSDYIKQDKALEMMSQMKEMFNKMEGK